MKNKERMFGMLTIYGLEQCSTTQKVKKMLEKKGLEFDKIIDIRENPPSKETIQRALKYSDGKYRKIMNSSGELYRELGLKDKLDDMSEEQIIDLLSEKGMLIKRPLITDGKKVSAGSKEADLITFWLDK